MAVKDGKPAPPGTPLTKTCDEHHVESTNFGLTYSLSDKKQTMYGKQSFYARKEPYDSRNWS